MCPCTAEPIWGAAPELNGRRRRRSCLRHRAVVAVAGAVFAAAVAAAGPGDGAIALAPAARALGIAQRAILAPEIDLIARADPGIETIVDAGAHVGYARALARGGSAQIDARQERRSGDARLRIRFLDSGARAGSCHSRGRGISGRRCGVPTLQPTSAAQVDPTSTRTHDSHCMAPTLNPRRLTAGGQIVKRD
jgi:hypothetical protein